jgi:hypothetical protein
MQSADFGLLRTVTSNRSGEHLNTASNLSDAFCVDSYYGWRPAVLRSVLGHRTGVVSVLVAALGVTTGLVAAGSSDAATGCRSNMLGNNDNLYYYCLVREGAG